MGIEIASSFTRKAAVPIDDLASVADLTARDAIEAGVRYEGMVVYVTAEATNYQLIGGTDNANWEEFSGGGGGGGVVELKPNDSTACPSFVQGNPIEYWKYSSEDEALWGRDVLPMSYKQGDSIFLELGKLFVNSNDTSKKVYFVLTAYIFKPGDDITSLDGRSGWYIGGGQVDVADTANTMLNARIEVGYGGSVSDNGNIEGDGVWMEAGDLLVFKLQAVTSPADAFAGDINVVDKTFRLNFKGD